MAEMAEEWQSNLVRDELRIATDTGGARSRAQLQEACGLGAGDLGQVLDELREAGEITEAEPDQFELLVSDGGPEREESLGEEEARVAEGFVALPPVGSRLAAAAEKRPVMMLGQAVHVPPSPATIRLTRGVLDALDAQSIGAVVKAGVEEAGDEPFVFEVV